MTAERALDEGAANWQRSRMIAAPEPVLTVAAMRAAEAATEVAEYELMERAGRGCAEWTWRIAAGRAVTVLCGPGNNGGDGYVVARVLRERGLDVAVIAPQEPASASAQQARAAYRGPLEARLGGRHAPVLVDALFGFGLARPIAGEFATLLEDSFAKHGYRVAIDVPSGVDCDAGIWLGEGRDYDLTLALGAWKRAHWLMPASAAMGPRKLVDIGVRAVPSERVSARPQLAAPAPDDHKYRRGLLAIVGGEMPGAAVLAAEAAMRAGAGYVKLIGAHPRPHAPPELVVDEAFDGALEDPRTCAIIIGPGLGRGDIARERLAAVLDTARPTVIDADALHLLDWDALEGVAGSRLLLTPHEGELAALCKAFGVAAESKLAKTQGLRDATGANVLAKGPDTILAAADGGLVFFPAASSWLSVAGTGDVLAGIAASRLAHHGDAARAAEEAVWLHREAARIADPAFTAGELARAVRPAFAAFL